MGRATQQTYARYKIGQPVARIPNRGIVAQRGKKQAIYLKKVALFLKK